MRCLHVVCPNTASRIHTDTHTHPKTQCTAMLNRIVRVSAYEQHDDCTTGMMAQHAYAKRCLFIVHSVRVRAAYEYTNLQRSPHILIKIWMKIIVKWKYTCMGARRLARITPDTLRCTDIVMQIHTSRWRQACAHSVACLEQSALISWSNAFCAFIVNERER